MDRHRHDIGGRPQAEHRAQRLARLRYLAADVLHRQIAPGEAHRIGVGRSEGGELLRQRSGDAERAERLAQFGVQAFDLRQRDGMCRRRRHARGGVAGEAPGIEANALRQQRDAHIAPGMFHVPVEFAEQPAIGRADVAVYVPPRFVAARVDVMAEGHEERMRAGIGLQQARDVVRNPGRKNVRNDAVARPPRD